LGVCVAGTYEILQSEINSGIIQKRYDYPFGALSWRECDGGHEASLLVAQVLGDLGKRVSRSRGL